MGSVVGRLADAEFRRVVEGSREEQREGGREFGVEKGWDGGCEAKDRRPVASVEAFSRMRSCL